MKKFKNILCAVLAAGTLAACSSGKGTFSTEIIGEAEGLKVIADGAGKDTAVGTSLDVLEGEHMAVSAEVTSGAIQLTVIGDGKSEPAVDFTFTESGQEMEYDLEPGTYNIIYTAAENKTTGTVSAVRVAAAVPAAGEADVQNPVMNFVGTYAKDRAFIEVSPADDKDGARFHINWSSSAAEHTEWDMTGTFDPETLTVSYKDAVKKDVVFKEDGTVESETVVYEDGTGTFTFSADDASLTWNDEKEHAADDMVFGFALID